jgi:hypothetical protein
MDLFSKITKRVSRGFSRPEKKVKYEFHKWKKQLIIADEIISVSVIILIFIGVFSRAYLMIGVYLLLYPYLFLTARKNAFYHLYVSSVIALIWVFIANSHYVYNQFSLNFFGLNAYPLFAWASGLFAVYIIYSHWEHKIKSRSFIKKLGLFIVIYWVLLIVVETLAYHVFNIVDVANISYLGLPICDCIHAPRWMQLVYFLMGPVYFIICELLGLENPHYMTKR